MQLILLTHNKPWIRYLRTYLITWQNNSLFFFLFFLLFGLSMYCDVLAILTKDRAQSAYTATGLVTALIVPCDSKEELNQGFELALG